MIVHTSQLCSLPCQCMLPRPKDPRRPSIVKSKLEVLDFCRSRPELPESSGATYGSVPQAHRNGFEKKNNQNPSLIERLFGAWQPRIPRFEQRRLAGAPAAPPPDPEGDEEIHSNTDIILPIPEDDILQSDDGGSSSTSTPTDLLPETDAATWFAAHVPSTEDMLSRIPAWGVEGVTTCTFPKLIALCWPSIMYEPIGKAETTCLRVKIIRGKGKGCAWPTEGIRQSFGSLENLSLKVHAFTRSGFMENL